MEPNFEKIDLTAAFKNERLRPLVRCDSPIEDIFLWDFRKVAADYVGIGRQHYCQTEIGAFKLDFMLSYLPNGARIGIECDGRDFHSPEHDSKRDAAIVAAGIVDKIYRLRGCDLVYRVHDTLHLLSKLERWMFSERGLIQLESRCRPMSLRHDYIGDNSAFFPGAALRMYDPPYDEDADCYEKETPIFPTAICWT